ncbi:MAG: ATP synthase F1 subunit delta [Candidatus Firestonebacteria bacterium]|nr:ATP synthase F1 subunit delta [Candidatus Firestonebacteria bacterium]
MSNEVVIAGKYARALLLLAQEAGRVEDVQGDLRLAAEVFGRGEGRELLLHPRLSQEQKQSAVQSLVKDKVGALTLSLLKLLIEKRRGSLVAEIAAAYAAEVKRAQGRQTATVTSAVPLTDEQMQILRRRLAAMAGAEVELTQEQDPALRGGARITLGDLLLDGSLGARLAQLRKALAGEHSQEN